MAKIWKNRIVAGTRSFSEVPLNWRNEVKLLFRQDVINGVITAEQYQMYVGEPYLI